MPELPEVETIRRGIQTIAQQKFVNIILRRSDLRWPIPKNLAKLVCQQPILAVKRRAKYLLLTTPVGTIIIHLGMSGVLRLYDQLPKAAKHDHVDFIFERNSLRYTDPRRFGAILFSNNWQQHPLLNNLGPEPLTNAFNSNYLFKQARHKTIAIKNFIMQNQIVVGVGNIYANEALFLAGIHPARPAGTLTFEQAKALCHTIKTTLKKAIKAGGTTLKDFKTSDGKPGYFKQKLLVYGRAGENCWQCDTTLEKIILGQRISVYCPLCQPN